MSISTSLAVKYIGTDFDIKELDSAKWKKVAAATIEYYWSGRKSRRGVTFLRDALVGYGASVRFEANQTEPLMVSDKPDRTKKHAAFGIAMYARFLSLPTKKERNKYF